ncbi:hypothetical protein K2Q00_02420 [Patescibacteria group bacterium]|nr:hypothetical protein [Patescibacteria group bacterium]
MMKTTLSFWQRLGDIEHEVACDYYHDGRQYIGGNSGLYYTGQTRPIRDR